MKPQMKRLQYLGIAKSLEEALDDSYDAFDAMCDAYIIANQNFEAKENDVDPACIVLGLQAQALGCRTLAEWLESLAQVTDYRYFVRGQEIMSKINRKMDGLGLVIPDTVVL